MLIFSTLAISTATICGTNVQVAKNQYNINKARSCAESGLEATRFWMNKVSITGTTTADQRLNQNASSLQSVLSTYSVSSTYDGSAVLTSNVTLDSKNNKYFYTILSQADIDTIQVDVTGVYGSIT